jgi:hypothetical protein
MRPSGPDDIQRKNSSFGLGFRRTGVVNDEIDPPAPARVARTFDAPLR